MFISVLWGLFQLPSVQTYTAKKVAAYFSKQLNTEIEVDKLEIEFWNSIVLNRLYIEDLQGDTLTYLNELKVDVEFFSWQNKNIESSLRLKGGKINVYKNKGEEKFNHKFLMDYFQSDNNEKPFIWNVSVDNLILEDNVFSFHDYNYEDKKEMLDFFHLDVEELNFMASNVSLKGDSLTAKIKDIRFNEMNGFDLKRFSADLSIYK